MRFKRILVTGGSGFIGSSFIRTGISKCERIINLDVLTYAADQARLESVQHDPRYRFIEGNINDQALVEKICLEEKIEAIVHFAAESHVDRSISGPHAFLETNVQGTFSLLEVVRRHPHIHFHHVSTDEVYGSLGKEGSFNESSPYQPNSPYAASKAASDHFVRAYAHTYNLSTTISHCCNNYGPYQHPEKFIPLILQNCLAKKPLPVYGTGNNVRDWLLVDDHSDGLWLILEKGKKGEVYDIGAQCEMTNMEMLHLILKELSSVTGDDYTSLITFVPDRPGHDFRYAIDSSKIQKELGWKPTHSLIDGLKETIACFFHDKSVKI